MSYNTNCINLTIMLQQTIRHTSIRCTMFLTVNISVDFLDNFYKEFI